MPTYVILSKISPDAFRTQRNSGNWHRTYPRAFASNARALLRNRASRPSAALTWWISSNRETRSRSHGPRSSSAATGTPVPRRFRQPSGRTFSKNYSRNQTPERAPLRE